MKLESVETKPRSLAKLSVVIIIAALAVLVIGWSVFWHVASGQTGAVLDAWMDQERQAGRVWACPDRKVGGYPFSIEIACSAPHFEGEVAGRNFSGTLQGFNAAAALFQPGDVSANLTAPFALRSTDGSVDVTLGWTALQLDLSGLPDVVTRIAVAGDHLSLQGTIAGIGAVAVRSTGFEGHALKLPQRQDSAYDFSLAASEVVSPFIDGLLGGAVPAAIDVSGTMTQADFGISGTFAERVERWRQAGGHIDLARAVATRGPTRFDGNGTLGLDQAHQLQGHLDAQFVGLEPILRQFGINPGLMNAGSLLSGLLGGKPRGGPQQGGAPALRLPVAMDRGLLSIGPVRTSIRLPPLY